MKNPVKYSPEVEDTICERIALGETLLQIADKPGMPSRKAVYLWLNKHDSFKEKMATARQFQADSHADQMYALLDELDKNPGQANAIRVKADILKWQAATRAPRKYGELIRQELRVEAPLSGEQVAARIKQLEQELGISRPVLLLAGQAVANG